MTAEVFHHGIEALVFGDDVVGGVPLVGTVAAEFTGEDEVEGVLARGLGFHQPHLGGVQKKMVGQLHRQRVLLTAQHQSHRHWFPGYERESDVLDVFVINVNVVDDFHGRRVACAGRR